MKTPIFLSAILVFCAASWSYGQGTLLAGHFGANNPATEGFTLSSGGTPSLSPVTDLGRDAWSIGLNADVDLAGYVRNFNPQEQLLLSSGGWVLSLSLRILEPFAAPNGGRFSIFYVGNQFFLLTFGAQSDGDPVVRIAGTSYVLDGAGDGYHNYQLRNSAITGVTSFWVDGNQFLTEIAGSSNPFNTFSLAWGGGQRPGGSAYANWNEASLSVIPEPSSLLLLSLGGLGLVAVRARARGKA